jgi:DNA mismatch repair protein MutL
MNKIKILPQNLINQIAAGEVIERPASIIKELVENSLDAEAKNIEISFNNGGKSLINIKDDGLGMSKDDLALCMQIHATSKLTNQNLSNINTLGFRGEALASICAVAKIQIASFDILQDKGFSINGANANISNIELNSINKGTIINVLDLFFFTPARLKFLKSENAETLQCYKTIKKLALANVNCGFKVFNNSKLAFFYPQTNPNSQQAYTLRAEQIMGKGFIQNSIFIEDSNPLFSIKGFLANSTFHSNTSEEQYIIINNRVIKDKNLSYAVKQAYSDILANYKHPIYVLWIDIDPNEIDVNVNPSKTEVRFKDIALVRHIIYNLVKKTLSLPQNQINNNVLANKLLNSGAENTKKSNFNKVNYASTDYNKLTSNNKNSISFAETKSTFNYNLPKHNNFNQLSSTNNHLNSSYKEDNIQHSLLEEDSVLGFAKAQLHKNWIISQTKNGFIIIDQHAAHERITQEKLLNQFLNNSVITQKLLFTEDIELDSEQITILIEYEDKINLLGVYFNIKNKIVNITELPAIISSNNPKAILLDIINNLKATEEVNLWNERLKLVINKIACHYSVRSGKVLNEAEMNFLIKEMLQTPNYGKCSHGRPTFIEFSLKDLEKFFGRSS